MRLRRRTITAAGLLAGALVVTLSGATAQASPPAPNRATAVGYGGAVSTVDPDATRVAVEVLRRGGNAVDAAVAAAAALGVTEPFSAGIGGGGFFVYYDARTRKVHTLDGRETAPLSMGENAFINPATGLAYAFDEARISGISAGVPGTPATWQAALKRWGTTSLRGALQPAIRLAQHGFVVDETFRSQVSQNLNALGQFDSSSGLFLPAGQPPANGSVFRNPDLADTYELMARQGTDAFYRGGIARDIVRTVQHPPVSATPVGTWAYPIRPGTMALSDLARYQVRTPDPTHVKYRGLDVYGMPTPSSGGSTVGEALNILSRYDLAGLTPTEALHLYLESSALSYADRNRFVGDYTPRPLLNQLLSPAYAAQRACLIDPTRAATKPVAPGQPGATGVCPTGTAADQSTVEHGTTNLTVADRWGNVVEYTLTIEAISGNAMVVPGRGFLLNNELTDFNFTPTQGTAADPNLPGPGKRPRSSMAPTIVLQHGKPLLAVGTPGGATIITTVLQILINRIDLGLDLPAALAAPRASQRNSASPQAEPAFLSAPPAAGLTALGHNFVSVPELGAATGIEFLPGGRLIAVAEPVRRGGGSAAVVRPTR